MPDMLVKLYDLPADASAPDRCLASGIRIRCPMPYEKSGVLDMIRREFGTGWADEAGTAFSWQPIRCVIATEQGRIVGFAAYDTTARGFFGPTGVLCSHRGRGIGKALLLASLRALAERGYAYAIIGQAGEKARQFYAKTVGATLIPGSDPGIYRDRLTPAE